MEARAVRSALNACPAWTESARLQILEDLAGEEIHHLINRRAAIVRRLEACAVDGQVFLWESGKDCDGYRYLHPLGACPATWLDYCRVVDEQHAAAEGPISILIKKPGDDCH